MEGRQQGVREEGTEKEGRERKREGEGREREEMEGGRKEGRKRRDMKEWMEGSQAGKNKERGVCQFAAFIILHCLFFAFTLTQIVPRCQV